MTATVRIELGPPCTFRARADEAVIVVDVIRSMTTATVALEQGRRLLPVASLAAAERMKLRLPQALLVGEQDGVRARGFDLTNSPAELAQRDDRRPVVLLSSSGTRLFDEVATAGAIYAACFRNRRAVADALAMRHKRVIVVGAATRGEFREEDQICCAHLAERLMMHGFAVEDRATRAFVERWSGAPPEAFLCSRSVAYLRATGQLDDLRFIENHFDDLDLVPTMRDGELVVLEDENVRSVGGV